MKQDLFEIGAIVNTHGVHGDVKITPWTDSAEVFETFDHLYVFSGDTPVRYGILRMKQHKFSILAELDGVTSMEAAEKLKGQTVYIERAALPSLQEDTYFIQDIMGARVETEDGRPVGILRDVFSTGSNDVYTVKNEETGKDILIPAIKSVIAKVDTENKVITVRFIEGLTDL